MVVDGGPDPDRLLIALDSRLPPWDRRIDVLVLTHPHEDHVAGSAAAARAVPRRAGLRAGDARAGTRLRGVGGRPRTAGRRARPPLDRRRDRARRHPVPVLWPDAGASPRAPPDERHAINNVSIVLLGEVGGERFLLAGDVEEGVDPILLGRGLPGSTS